jgi:sulfur relay (sulfurtransferase) complex TusBCD TusD component (DsrE family)
MGHSMVVAFTRFGMGNGPQELQTLLAGKFLKLILQSGKLPVAILFYTDGVKLTCPGSPVLDDLQALEQKGVRLVLCQTCLEFYGLQPVVGVVGGMGDIIEAMQKADQVISL